MVYRVVSYDIDSMVFYWVEWYGLIFYGVALYGSTPYDPVWYGMLPLVVYSIVHLGV